MKASGSWEMQSLGASEKLVPGISGAEINSAFLIPLSGSRLLAVVCCVFFKVWLVASKTGKSSPWRATQLPGPGLSSQHAPAQLPAPFCTYLLLGAALWVPAEAQALTAPSCELVSTWLAAGKYPEQWGLVTGARLHILLQMQVQNYICIKEINHS